MKMWNVPSTGSHNLYIANVNFLLIKNEVRNKKTNGANTRLPMTLVLLWNDTALLDFWNDPGQWMCNTFLFCHLYTWMKLG